MHRDAALNALNTLSARSALLLGRACFVVLAQSLPTGFNARPGVTVLLAMDQAMDLDIEGQVHPGLRAAVLAPGLRRRFLRACPHISVTVEPGHALYRRFLDWSQVRGKQTMAIEPALSADWARQALTLPHALGLDQWLAQLLRHFGQYGPVDGSPKLRALLDLLDGLGEPGHAAQAESVWPAFSRRYPGTTAAHARWMKREVGLSLRQFLLWRKLRAAMDLLGGPMDATAIAHAAGFADSSHLWRTCTRVFGLPPSQAADRKTVQVRTLPIS